MSYRIKPDVPPGGRANDSGGCFHLSFRSGSRAGGACARSAFDYVTRSDRYDDPDRDEALYTESGNMPDWADDNPAKFWDAADLHERANGRLFVSADFALPRDLPLDDQIALARDFARQLTDQERLPYTVAIHGGRDDAGHGHNPHAHLMFSERQNDGISRSKEQWFRRANSQHPERGGAPKSRTFHGPEWIERAREQWADLANATLERNGRSERLDHRSYERQGIEREPGHHYGPSGAHMVGQGRDHDRLEGSVGVLDRHETLRELDDQIAQLETVREGLLQAALHEANRQPDTRDDSRPSGPDYSDESSRGR